MSPQHQALKPRPPLPALIGLIAGAVLIAAAIVGAGRVPAPHAPPGPPPSPVPEAAPVQTPSAVPAQESYDAAQVIEGYVQAALAYKQRGRLDRTIALLEDVLRQYPTVVGPPVLQAHYVLAWAYEAKGRKSEALREFRIVLRLARPGTVARREAEWGIRRVTRRSQAHRGPKR